MQLRRGNLGLFPNSATAARRTTRSTTAGAGPTDMVMWNGVGGSTVHLGGRTGRACIRPTSACTARRRRRRLANRVRGARAVLRPQRSQGRRRRASPATRPTRRRSPRPMPPLPLGRGGERRRARLRPARLALVAVGQRDPLAPTTTAGTGCDNRGRATSGCPRGREGVGRRHLLAESDRARRARADPRARDARSPSAPDGRVAGAPSTSTRRAPCTTQPAGGRRLLQRHRHAAPAARVDIAALSRRPRQRHRHGRAALDDPPEPLRRRASSTSRSRPPGATSVEPIYSASSSTRPTARAASSAATRSVVYRPGGPASVAWGDREPRAVGQGASRRDARGGSRTASASR